MPDIDPDGERRPSEADGRAKPGERPSPSSGGDPPPTHLGKYPLPRIRVAALIVKEQQVLLVRHRKRRWDYWLLPGGGLDRGESLTEALLRELREEVGAAAELHGPPIALLESISPDEGKERHAVHVVFAAVLLDPPGTTPTIDAAVRELRWFQAEELPSLDIRPPIPHLVADWMSLFAHGIPAEWPPLVHERCAWRPEPDSPAGP